MRKQQYPVVSNLEQMKHRLEQWSLPHNDKRPTSVRIPGQHVGVNGVILSL